MKDIRSRLNRKYGHGLKNVYDSETKTLKAQEVVAPFDSHDNIRINNYDPKNLLLGVALGL